MDRHSAMPQQGCSNGITQIHAEQKNQRGHRNHSAAESGEGTDYTCDREPAKTNSVNSIIFMSSSVRK